VVGVVAVEQWATALKTYRESIDMYRHVLNLRERRQRATPRHSASNLAPDARVTPAPPEIGLPTDLTKRECEVARLLALGYSNAQIADELVITTGTTANHVAHILSKLGVANRAQVVARLLQPTPSATGDVRPPGRSGRSIG
jgi:DNA-binding NarL/FixJ family response regulator